MSGDVELTLESAGKLISDIYIPPRPEILEKLSLEVQKPDYNIQAITRIISQDVAISAAVIKTINSPFFGIPKEVVSIHQAVMLLGTKNVINLVSAFCLKEAITYRDKVFMERFWKESTEIALTATYIAQKVSSIPADEFYLLGLLHNCGVPLLMQKFEDYPAIYQKAESMTKMSISVVENNYFHINHALVGYMVGKRWKFPQYICTAIARHHDTQDYFSQEEFKKDPATHMLAVLKVAEHIIRMYYDLNDTWEWSHLEESILNFFGLTSEEMEALSIEALEMLQ